MMKTWEVSCILLVIIIGVAVTVVGEKVEVSSSSEEEQEQGSGKKEKKLLIIMLDGFRWDYYELQKHELRGFPLFLKEGVQTEWVEPVFPSESYPAWTTISTGVYPENHGILGNYMYDLKHNATFNLNDELSTGVPGWWQNAEPLWTTATRYNKRAFLHLWSRCDVPFEDIIPHRCTSYRPASGVKAINDTLNKAIDHLLQDYQLAMVYGEHLDNVGHSHGPHSEELKQAIRDVDDVIHDFLDRLTDEGLDERVNVIIVSDHGMTWVGEGSGTIYVPMADFIDGNRVQKVVGYGAVMSVVPYSRQLDQVYEQLKNRRGFDAYKREQIPDELRYKHHRLVPDIVIVAQPSYFLLGLQSPVQIPTLRGPSLPRGGSHGYANMTDMRTIFFARGPDFKKGVVHPPIHLVDEYQLFAKLLDIPVRPNNGTWSKVAGMLVSDAISVNLNVVLLVPIVFISLQ